MKNKSLQDQLLGAGLVTESKAKQVRSEKRKKNKQPGKKTEHSEAKDSLQQQKIIQAEKDKRLNEQRKKAAEKQQLSHQIKQLVDQDHEPIVNDDKVVAYRFNDNGAVKTLYISIDQKNRVASGKLAIIWVLGKYYLVNKATAEKIRLRDETAVKVLFDEEEKRDDDYQGYEIPDDLMW